MAELKSWLESDPQAALAAAGFAIGFAFGALAQRTNFCVMGAVSDWRTSGSMGRIGAAAIAALTAITGAQLLDAAHITDLSRSIYLVPRLNWAGAIGGGLLFGYGMVQAGGCASRNLVRAGAGDVRSFVTLLVLALAAFVAMSGILGPVRSGFEAATVLPLAMWNLKTQALGEVAAHAGLEPSTGRYLAMMIVAAPLAAFAIWKCKLLRDPVNIAAGLGVGALVSLGWLVTGQAYDEMAVSPTSVTSLSFVRPVADAADWLQRATALGLPGFGAASVFGVLTGSFMSAVASKRFGIQAFAGKDDFLRHLGGALAMGIGGVFALGCSIGQGITGLSTLSVQSLLAAVSILAGAWWALDRLERQL